jgi:hypothetical protein
MDIHQLALMQVRGTLKRKPQKCFLNLLFIQSHYMIGLITYESSGDEMQNMD